MQNKKEIIKYKNFKRMKGKEKTSKNCWFFTESDNIRYYSKMKINKLVPLNFIETVSAGTRVRNLSPADTCY